MGFGTAILACVEKFMIFQGRASRAEFWWFFLAWLIASVIAVPLELLLDTKMISIGIQVVFILPALAAAVRRLHDTGRSARYLVIVALPVPFLFYDQRAWAAAMLFAIALMILILSLPGQEGPNRYGPDPRVNPDLDAFE